MEGIFLRLLNMSLSASVVIVLVLLVRLMLRRAMKKWSCFLWAAPAFRLLCPVSFRASFSLFQLRPPAGGSGPAAGLTYISGPAVPITVQRGETLAGPVLSIAAVLWCAGLMALILYAVVNGLRMRKRLSDAVQLEDRLYETDRISAPFLMGLLHPRIYLPAGLSGERLACALLHERAHLRRGDHWVKLLAFLVLSLHWFNPLVWLAFFLLSRDMEMSCDERVLAEEGCSAGEYSRSLLSFAAPRRFPLGPPAFGETGVKRRIQNALRWKRPRKWVERGLLLLCVLLLLLCAANPIVVKHPWVQEYLPGQGNIKGHVNTAKYLAVSEDFAIGANAAGYAVFKDPYRALRTLSVEYADTLGKLRTQNLLPRLSYGNYRRYQRVSWNPAWAATEEERRDAAFILGFFDIYENSFEP